jgi:hypothetical protein
VMLVPFVNQMNNISDFAKRSGPIVDEDREVLVGQLIDRRPQEAK